MDHAEYCEAWLSPSPHYGEGRHDRPPWQETLIVKTPDNDYGGLDHIDKGTVYRAMPEKPNHRFAHIGCPNSFFIDSKKSPKGNCPYHEPRGLKMELDGGKKVERYDPSKQIGEWYSERIAERDANERKQAEQSQKAEGKKKSKGEEGCCVVQ